MLTVLYDGRCVLCRRAQAWLDAFGDVIAVRDLNLEIADGEFFSLIGPSGCGKTTTGRSVLRLIEPTAGSVKFEGRELVGLPRSEMRPNAAGNNPSAAAAMGNWPTTRTQPLSAPKHEIAAPAATR